MAEASRLYRYERKFRVDRLDAQQVRALIRLHPALFREPYPPRYVNSLYLDTAGLDNYYDNVNGAYDRRKVRIRWYGELSGRLSNPTLEFKIKRGQLGLKVQYPLAPFTLDETFSNRYLQEILQQSDLPPQVRLHLANEEPVLLTRYYRWYFATAGRRYRATVDAGMLFHNVRWLSNSFLHSHQDHRHLVLELKYAHAEDRHADRVASYFPFPVTKSSKYAQGIQAVCVR